MGRIVKLWDTGEKGDRDLAYHAPDGKNYSCKAAYDNLQKEKQDWKKCIDEIMFLFGYEKDMKPNTYTFKLLKELKPYGYDVVYDTLIQQNKAILWALNTKKFNNETMKIKYVFAIINNNILEVYKKKQYEEKQQRQENKIIELDNYRRSIEETDVDYNSLRGASGKRRDVSKFLGDKI